MKNITQYLFVTLSILFVGSSCTVNKRLHNPGYHVQLNKKVKGEKPADQLVKADEQIAFTDVKTEETNLPTIEAPENSSAEIVATNEIATNYTSDLASNDESISFQITNSPKRSLIQAKSTVENQPVKVEKEAVKSSKKAKKNATSNSNNAAGGATLALLVILCLFPLINLIPVYITDGGITLNFWVTLILNLTYIGAVIFSLLVVLGVISLA